MSLLDISSGLKAFVPVVCVLKARNADLKEAFLKRNIEIIDLDITSKLWWVEGPRKLRKIVNSVHPDIVHATLFKSEIITRIAMRGSEIPHIGSFVNDSYAANRYKHQPFIRNMKLNVVRLADAITARWVTHFMSISGTIAESNAKALRLDKKKITCIYRGRNIKGYPVFHPSRDGAPFTFLTVARLLKRKGYLELFQATRRLADKGYDFKLLIAGDGRDYNLFKEFVLKLNIQDRVEFLKNRTDVPDLLASSHCFVFPSHYEGQGGALVEAMLAAKPIIASDIPVFCEQITDEVTGKLFQVFNASALADKMQWMVDHYDEGVRLGNHARETAIIRFNIETTVRLHEALYTQVLQDTSAK